MNWEIFQRAASSAGPDIVYHYTSLDALLGIIESENIRATNLRYLNDVGEYTYGLALLREYLPSFLRLYTTEYSSAFKEAISKVDPKQISDYPYAASFSALDDSLPQWRAYCPLNSGLSIGFRVEALRKTLLEVPRKTLFPVIQPILRKVHYLDHTSTEEIYALIHDCLHEMSTWDKSLEDLRKERDCLPTEEQYSIPDPADPQTLQAFVEQRASLMKHKAFSNESEYRLLVPYIFSSSDAVKYRSARTTLVPYVNCKMPPWEKVEGASLLVPASGDYFIAEVVVGPTANPELTVDSLKNLFAAKRVQVNVRSSVIPFRDL